MQYMMENYEKSWRQSGPAQIAYYENVPPGHYLLRVKAASSDGVWTEKTLSIIVNPPWWQTWWAYCIYGLFLMAGIYAIHRIQKQRVIQKERNRTRGRELKQAKEIEKAYYELRKTQSMLIQQEKMASLGELTAGIAHEIQNPLNFVNNFSQINAELVEEAEGLIKGGKAIEAIELLSNLRNNELKITDHGQRADAIVKSMLLHSRTGSGQRQLTDINALVKEYLKLSYQGQKAKDSTFHAILNQELDEKLGEVAIVPQDVGRVMLNLFNNAFYTESEKRKLNLPGYEPALWVSTNKKDGKVVITVRDNGLGIQENLRDKIFQPFFTTKPAGQGTGLGLSMSYDIIKAHGGDIRVESEEGIGAEFIVELPV